MNGDTPVLVLIAFFVGAVATVFVFMGTITLTDMPNEKAMKATQGINVGEGRTYHLTLNSPSDQTVEPAIGSPAIIKGVGASSASGYNASYARVDSEGYHFPGYYYSGGTTWYVSDLSGKAGMVKIFLDINHNYSKYYGNDNMTDYLNFTSIKVGKGDYNASEWTEIDYPSSEKPLVISYNAGDKIGLHIDLVRREATEPGIIESVTFYGVQGNATVSDNVRFISQ